VKIKNGAAGQGSTVFSFATLQMGMRIERKNKVLASSSNIPDLTNIRFPGQTSLPRNHAGSNLFVPWPKCHHSRN